jgi:site-specific DNA recombinase
MTTAAIYARFSTDRQDATSIADQIRVCRARAKAIGLDILGEYSDAAVSGAIAVLDRPGAGAMHAAALAGKFDVLLVESLDRLSRDSVDSEAVLRRLEHRGLRIIGVADSYDTASGESRRIVRGVRGLINEFYRSDLPHKIRRGLEGQVERGFHAGGMSYGYRSVPVGMNARGEAEGFRLEIEPQHAEVVRWIYARYAEGWSCQRIAADLNRRSVRGPGRRRLDRPSTWSVAALYGTPTAGSGILNNELYVGRYIWNRREWVRDPDKPKKRVPRIRPQEQWRVKERPELRIVDDALWNAVRGRMTRKNGDSGHLKRGPGPRTLFGGLLRCGRCGGAVIAVSGREYGCAARKDRGAAVCTGVRAPRKETDRRLVGVLREEVLSPHAIAQIRDQVRRILSESQQQAMEISKSREVRIRALEGEIKRLTDAVAELGLSKALKARLMSAEAEYGSLTGRVESRPPPLPSTEAIGAKIREVAMRLDTALGQDVTAARAILAGKLGPVVIEERDGAVWAQMQVGPALLFAAGAGFDSIQGCGGRI